MHTLSAQSNKYFYRRSSWYKRSVGSRLQRAWRLAALFYLLAFISTSSSVAWAQLPPTNMGKFVHTPGDNQYTAQTQAERHGASIPAAAPVVQPTSAPVAGDYKPTPAAPRADISLLPIVADEPIKPAGFPPLPDRLDLPINGTAIWAGNNGGSIPVTSSRYISSSPTGVHEHYVHYEPGAFIPPQALAQTQAIYRPAATDYYNINPAARPAFNSPSQAVATVPTIPTPATNALHHLPPQPGLACDPVSKPEAPSAVTVNQSVSQDLSLPEDDFNKHYPTPIGNSPGRRASYGIGRVLTYPLMGLGYSASGMMMGAASTVGMYSLYRR
jgi:hypothetical protein